MKLFHSVILLTFIFSMPAQAAVIKIATLSPDGTSWMKKMHASAKEISTLTNNRVKIKFYPGGVMGDEKAILRKMRINQLQGAAVTNGALANHYNDADLYSMPFVFNNHGEVNHIRKHMDKLIIEGLKDKGLISFGLAESGFAYILSNAPVRSLAELRKQKAWVPDTANARDAAQAFRFNPIPLPIGDVLTGLQTGLINTVATSPIASIALQWYSQVKHLTDMPLLYSWATLVISEKALKKLKPGDRDIVNKVMTRSFIEIDQQNKKDNTAALAALKTQKILFVKPSHSEKQEWLTLAKTAQNKLVALNHVSKNMYDLMLKHLTAYRSKH